MNNCFYLEGYLLELELDQIQTDFVLKMTKEL